MKQRDVRRQVDVLSLVDEAVSSLLERRSRSLLTTLGTVLGVSVLVAVLGLTATASSQIDSRFNSLSATEVTITQTSDPVITRSMIFPGNFRARIKRLTGVVDAGLTWSVPPEHAEVAPSSLEPGATDPSIGVSAVSPGALRVALPTMKIGRIYDQFAETRAERVAVLGPSVAASLGVASLARHPVVHVGGVAFTIVGVLDKVQRHPELLNGVLLPTGTAKRLWGEPTTANPPTGWVAVQRGAGDVVAGELAAATSPIAPDRFVVNAPPDPRHLRGTVNGDLQRLFLFLAAVCLVVGMVGIANTTFVTVVERVGEIGLRRSLGARRWHIVLQLLAESAVTGTIGGVAGSVVGLGVVVSTSAFQGWTAVAPPLAIVAGPLLGLVTAVVASLYPAWRAAHIEPVTALRLGAS